MSSPAILPPRRSLAGWAALALAMVLFSYVLTVSLAAACVYFPWQLLTGIGFNLNVLILFVVGVLMAATMLWSLIPRRDRFKPPGPLLTLPTQPRLFAEIQKIAWALGEPVPEAVYLIPDANAWVARRGGLLGFGGQRIMGLGLPLLEVLSVSEFRAVLAHEFGHYYGGDTRLGPWVYAARMTMARTLVSIGSESPMLEALGRIGVARLAHLLVVAILAGYWKLFMRATQLVSRRQEYRADELACAVAGSAALSGGLRQIEGLSAVLPLFLQSAVKPALQAGCRVPLAAGFAQFAGVPEMAAAISKHVEQKLKTAKTQAYDSHPPLRDRLAAAQSYGGGEQAVSQGRAATLFDGIDALEVQLLQTLAPPGANAADLRLVTWDRINSDVYLPLWRATVAGQSKVLAGLKVEDVVRLALDARGIAAEMRDPPGRLLSRPQRLEAARGLLWTAFTVTLLDHGWRLCADPGGARLQRGEHVLDPNQLARETQSGKLTPNAWLARAAELGIGPLPLVGD